MRNNKLLQLFCLLLFQLVITFGYSQETKKDEASNFKHFTVKIYNGYSITKEWSKLQVVGGKFAVGNSPTIGISLAWYYNKNWSVELSASSGKYKIDMVNGEYTKMDLYRDELSLGYVWMTPLNISFRYHFTSLGKVIPYVATGGSYMLFTNVDPGWAANAVNYENRPALNFAIGTDLNITKHWFVNAQIQKIMTDKSNVMLDFDKSIGWVLKTQLSPELISFTAGVGYRF